MVSARGDQRLGPGQGSLRIRAAITEAQRSNVALDIASTVLPPARLASAMKKLATDTHAFVGRAAIEILDGVTNQRLVAAIDERVGAKSLRGSSHSWADVEAASDHCAELVSARLALFRWLDRGEPGDTDGGEG